MQAVTTFLIVFGAHLNILAIIKVKSFALTKLYMKLRSKCIWIYV